MPTDWATSNEDIFRLARKRSVDTNTHRAVCSRCSAASNNFGNVVHLKGCRATLEDIRFEPVSPLLPQTEGSVDSAFRRLLRRIKLGR